MDKYEVCKRCRGEGKHVNSAIDGNGLTAEDFASLGPDFEEDYFGGAYDVTCEECNGLRVVQTYESMTEEEKEDADFDREWASERMWESRMLGEF